MTIEDERREPDEETPEEAAPEEATPEERPSDEAVPEEAAPEEAATPEEAEETVPEEAAAPEAATPEETAPEEAAPQEQRRPRREEPAERQSEVVPGADLEPDLVLDQPTGRAEHDEYGDAAYAARYADPEAAETAETEPTAEAEEAPEVATEPAPRTPMELAADARYRATGKRKTSVARVILRPGSGSYTVNGRSLEAFFPRPGLQQTVRQPLEAAGYESRMDVVARLHGGGVSSQAGALRHGVARALVEADPALRGELKRRGYLTRDPRSKERKKAGLKKARKRPQFSKR